MVDAPKALVVNDHMDIAYVLGRKLDMAGSAVHDIAVTYKQALASFEKGRYGIAIVDTNLPDGNGPDLAGALYDIDPRIYIVGVSVHRDFAELWEGRADDFQEVLRFNPMNIFSGFEAKKRKNEGLTTRRISKLA